MLIKRRVSAYFIRGLWKLFLNLWLKVRTKLNTVNQVVQGFLKHLDIENQRAPHRLFCMHNQNGAETSTFIVVTLTTSSSIRFPLEQDELNVDPFDSSVLIYVITFPHWFPSL